MTLRKIALGLVISGVCLYFVLRGVEWGQVLQHLSEVDPALFLLSMLLMLAAYFLMTWRWQRLLDPLDIPGTPGSPGAALGGSGSIRGHESLSGLYGKMMTGYFFNAFFPARGGDLDRKSTRLNSSHLVISYGVFC